MGKLLAKLGAGDGYDPWITINKFIVGFIIVLVPQFLLYSLDYINTPGNIPAEYVWIVPILVGIITSLINAWKHWGDTA